MVELSHNMRIKNEDSILSSAKMRVAAASTERGFPTQMITNNVSSMTINYPKFKTRMLPHGRYKTSEPPSFDTGVSKGFALGANGVSNILNVPQKEKGSKLFDSIDSI